MCVCLERLGTIRIVFFAWVNGGHEHTHIEKEREMKGKMRQTVTLNGVNYFDVTEKRRFNWNVAFVLWIHWLRNKLCIAQEISHTFPTFFEQFVHSTVTVWLKLRLCYWFWLNYLNVKALNGRSNDKEWPEKMRSFCINFLCCDVWISANCWHQHQKSVELMQFKMKPNEKHTAKV